VKQSLSQAPGSFAQVIPVSGHATPREQTAACTDMPLVDIQKGVELALGWLAVQGLHALAKAVETVFQYIRNQGFLVAVVMEQTGFANANPIGHILQAETVNGLALKQVGGDAEYLGSGIHSPTIW
jgi:hypothetical protein